ncbi:hypothetical protein [Streptomyces niveus]|uniref:hypothetical protein n=1 Tax=Streptomyces niveus TaxID=193462 RepID=UPI00341B030D
MRRIHVAPALAGLLGAVLTLTAVPDTAPCPAPATTVTVGADNRDGRIGEDETGWDCATMGNRQCAPVAQVADH